MSENMSLMIADQYGLDSLGNNRAIIRANVGAGEVSMRALQQVHVPSGDTVSFVTQTLDGDAMVKSLVGIIVAFTEQRRYYAEVYSPGGDVKPPDCASVDLVKGIGVPGGLCSECPYNQYGSARAPDGGVAKGKACSQYRYLLMLEPGRVLPTVVAVPPSSLKSAKGYFMRLATFGKAYHDVITEISLERGSPVSTMAFRSAGELSREQIERMAGYRADMDELFIEGNKLIGVDVTEDGDEFDTSAA